MVFVESLSFYYRYNAKLYDKSSEVDLKSANKHL